jgi:hypothetical protein
MTTMTALDLTNLERLEAAATPGPWHDAHGELVHDYDGDGYVKLAQSPCPQSPVMSARRKAWNADRAFIPALRNAAPAFIAAAKERDELRARIGELEAALGDAHAALDRRPSDDEETRI